MSYSNRVTNMLYYYYVRLSSRLLDVISLRRKCIDKRQKRRRNILSISRIADLYIIRCLGANYMKT